MSLTKATCRTCEEEFTYERKRKGRARVYCSDSCKWKPWNTGAKAKSRRLKFDFGITLEDWSALLAAQGGICPGCGKEPPYLPEDLSKTSRTSDRFVVDHDHSSGIIRGLLCSNCNLVLGYSADSAQVLRNLADYLDSVPGRGTLLSAASDARTAYGSGNGRG